MRANEDQQQLAEARAWVRAFARDLDAESRYVRELESRLAAAPSTEHLVNALEADSRGAEHAGKSVFAAMSLTDKLRANLVTPETRPFRFSAEEAAAVKALLRAGREPVRILSMPCSLGHEAVTLAAFCHEVERRFVVVGADVQPELVRAAESLLATNVFEAPVRAAVAESLTRGSRLQFVVADAHAPRSTWGGAFDLVLCRNFLGFFRESCAVTLIRNVAELVADGGHVLVDAFCVGKLPGVEQVLGAWGERSGEVPLYRKRGVT